MCIGYMCDGNYPFEGALSDLRFYDKRLEDYEI